MSERETRKVILSLEMTGEEIDSLKTVMIFEPTTEHTDGIRLFRHDDNNDIDVRLLIVNKDKVIDNA